MLFIPVYVSAGAHPNVIQLLGVWRLEGDVILAMPYLPHVRYGTIPYDAVVRGVRLCCLIL